MFALLCARGALSQQQILSAGPLDKHEVRRAITAMRKTAVIERIAPPEGGRTSAGRYALTGKMLGRHKPADAATPVSDVRFDELLVAWGIAMPRLGTPQTPSRVIKTIDINGGMLPAIPRFVTIAAPSTRSLNDA